MNTRECGLEKNGESNAGVDGSHVFTFEAKGESLTRVASVLVEHEVSRDPPLMRLWVGGPSRDFASLSRPEVLFEPRTPKFFP